jgi:hypothetical protein
MGARNRRLAAAAALAAGVTLGAGTWNAGAQLLPPMSPGQDQPPVTLFPPPPDTTPTTVAPPPTTAPAPTDTPDATAPGDGSTSSTDPGAGDGDGFSQTTAGTAGEQPPPADGDGEVAPAGGVIPPDAQRAISAIARTAPNDNGPLVEGAAALEAAGVPHDEVVRLVYGRFPILGPARWSDDWYMPRWTGTLFRYHLGLDVVAAYGTPVASPAHGTARIASNALGGLTVRVVEPSGTFWYLAHLSGIADGSSTVRRSRSGRSSVTSATRATPGAACRT